MSVLEMIEQRIAELDEQIAQTRGTSAAMAYAQSRLELRRIALRARMGQPRETASYASVSDGGRGGE